MKILKERTVSTKVIDLVVCNFCGEFISKNEHEYLNDYVSISKEWGYFSNYDGQTHCIDICQKCYEKLLSQMKHKPFT